MIAGIIYNRAEQMGTPFDSVEDTYLEANTMFEELRDNGSLYSEKWDLDIVATGEGSWTNEGGLSAAEDIIAGHADELNLIMCSCDPMGAGAITAIKNAGLTPGEDIYVGCAADGGQEMFPYLESGEMLVTGYNSPDLNGSAAIDLVHMILKKAMMPIIFRQPQTCLMAQLRAKTGRITTIRIWNTARFSILISERLMKSGKRCWDN